jgi:RNA polymerase sigma factor (sigma-70 family)
VDEAVMQVLASDECAAGVGGCPEGELLKRFAERREEAAFQELVARHVRWVHGAALRQVRDPGKALDVTQAVFILLAQKATSMDPSKPLAPWLFWSLGYAVKALRRSEARRRKHEAAAVRTAGQPSVGAALELAELLDGAVARLPAADKQAILLRFYEERSLAEVAAALRTTEEAAKKRVARAVETLRAALSSRGYTGATLGGFAVVVEATLRAPAATPAPGAVAAGALGAGGVGTSFLLAKGATAMATAAKLKTVAAVVLSAAVVTAGGLAVRSLQGQGGAVASRAAAAGVLREPVVVATEPAVSISQQPTHNARVSPDGRYVLYVGRQRVNGEEREVLIRRNLETQGISVVTAPMAAGYQTVLLRLGTFREDGALLVPQARDGGTGTAPAVAGPIAPPVFELVVMQGDPPVVETTGLSGPDLFAKPLGKGVVGFTRGAMFVAKPPAYEKEPLELRGMVNAVSPGGDVLAVLVLPERRRGGPVQGAASAPRPAPTFVLYDLTTRKQTELPMHPENTVLDDCEAEFTADGRYVYYRDFRSAADGKLVGITRVWDRTAGKGVAELEDMVPLGPGPTPGTMWLATSPGQGNGAVVHDAAAGKMERFLAGKDVQHATGQRVAYLEKAAEGKWVLKVVDVEAGAAGR